MTNHDPREWSYEERQAATARTRLWSEFVSARPEMVATLRAQSSQVAEVQAMHEERLVAMPNVVGVATGLKTRRGRPDETVAVQVLVERKVPAGQLAEADLVPARIDGVVTDVVEVGVIRPLLFVARVRPALPGYSIGHPNVTAGTFGCLVHDLRQTRNCACRCDPCRSGQHGRDGRSEQLILSNNHVFAATNSGIPGDPILQPGRFDGGTFPADTIATLERFEPITFDHSDYNLIDAAVARPTRSRNVAAAIAGVFIPTGVAHAALFQEVQKYGRTTQLTNGTVIGVNATIAVDYGAPGIAMFRHQILTTPMAAGGDSGSLLLTADKKACGLLFAGSTELTVHNNISDVTNGLGVYPVTTTG